MLALLANAFQIATRTDTRPNREKLAEQRRWDEEYFYQGRRSPDDGQHRQSLSGL